MKKIGARKGMVLISTYLVISLVGTFSYALFSKNISSYRAYERTTNRIISFQLAETAVDQAIVQLRNNLNYTGQSYTAFSKGGYNLQVDIPNQASPTLRRITANGHTPNNVPTAYAYEGRQVVAYVDFQPNNSNFSIFGDSKIEMGGNSGTDSYDSANGDYDTQTPGANGDIGTNSVAAGAIEIGGSAHIKGDAVVGPGGNPSSVIQIGGSAQIDGAKISAPAPTPLDPVVVPGGLANGGALVAGSNDQIILGGGTYWYSSISISAGGQVKFTGPTTVYVTGNVAIGGNGIGTSGNLPPNLTIKVAGTATVEFTGGAKFFGKVYAPNAEVEISGNGGVYGSVVGNKIELSGDAKIHYDEALNPSGSNNQNKSNLLAWQEN